MGEAGGMVSDSDLKEAAEMAELKPEEAGLADRGNEADSESADREKDDKEEKPAEAATDEVQDAEVDQLINEEMSTMIEVKPADEGGKDADADVKDVEIVDEELKKMDEPSEQPDGDSVETVGDTVPVENGEGSSAAEVEVPDVDEELEDTAYGRLMIARKEGKDPVPDHENRQRALRELYLQYANDPSRQKKVEPDSPYLGKRKSQEEKFNAHLLAMDKFTNLLDMQLRLLESTDEDLRESDKEMVKVYVNKWKTKSGMGTEN